MFSTRQMLLLPPFPVQKIWLKCLWKSTMIHAYLFSYYRLKKQITKGRIFGYLEKKRHNIYIHTHVRTHMRLETIPNRRSESCKSKIKLWCTDTAKWLLNLRLTWGATGDAPAHASVPRQIFFFVSEFALTHADSALTCVGSRQTGPIRAKSDRIGWYRCVSAKKGNRPVRGKKKIKNLNWKYLWILICCCRCHNFTTLNPFLLLLCFFVFFFYSLLRLLEWVVLFCFFFFFEEFYFFFW